MKILKTLKNTDFTESTIREIAEYWHSLEDRQVYVVMKGYVNQLAFDNGVSNARRVYRLDTFKKEETRKLYEDVIIPAVTEEVEIEAVIDEEGNELEPARTDIVTVEAERVEQREIGEETIWLNEKDYIDVSQLVWFILPFIWNTLISQGDFIDWTIE
jgi:hypothetical protein